MNEKFKTSIYIAIINLLDYLYSNFSMV